MLELDVSGTGSHRIATLRAPGSLMQASPQVRRTIVSVDEEGRFLGLGVELCGTEV